LQTVAALVVFLLALLTPARSEAIFHLAHISEVMSGITGDPSVQFVEIRMDLGFQNVVGNTRLTAFSCSGAFVVLTTLPPPTGPGGTVPNQGAGRHWIMGTPSLAAKTTPSVTPDFTFAGGIPGTCGMVCWGAPVDPVSGFAKDPATWSASDPNNYVDCVAYGPYTGPQRTGAGPPASATPGDGVHSLTRVSNVSNDFTLTCPPTPTNNGPLGGGAEVTGTFGPCAPASTTTTVAPTTTSSTTTTSPTTTSTSSTTTTTRPTSTTTTQPSTTTSSTSMTSSSTTTTASSTSSTSTTATTPSTTTTTSPTVTTTTTSSTTTVAQPTSTTSTTSTTTSSVTTTTLGGGNVSPDCGAAAASPAELWPPNHQLAGASVAGVTDPDGDPVTVTITGVRQDEPVGATCPDATGVGTAVASLRVERLGSGDGRVYEMSFTAADGRGGQCSGTVTVCVPHDQRPGHACGDQGPLFDSTGPCSSVCGNVCAAIEPTLAAPLCPGERVPAALKLRVDHARQLLRRAAVARRERKVRTLLARMVKRLGTSAALVSAAEEKGSISRACGAALAQRLGEAQGQAVGWSRTR